MLANELHAGKSLGMCQAHERGLYMLAEGPGRSFHDEPP